jgi:3-hydroxyacyl-[acyl-carrier-protein] dehydratase
LRKIKAEIEKHMTGLARNGKALTSHFLLPPEFIGFQGHFPEKKILPGVCQIQCALSALEKEGGRSVVLKEVVLAKYFTPLFPDEAFTCVVSEVDESNGVRTVKAVITKKEGKVSDMKLRICCPDGEGKS